ncbi:putative ribonuclease H-like domain-containing protein [Tanacetum coccineum]
MCPHSTGEDRNVSNPWNILSFLPKYLVGEYDMWRLRIEQYFQVQDYALWDVIENGNSFKPVAQTTTNADGTSTLLIPGPVTTEEKVQKKNDVKARNLVALEDCKSAGLSWCENVFTRKTQLNFVRCLPSEWEYSMLCLEEYKPDLDTMSLRLYKNLKIVEQRLKETASSKLKLNQPNGSQLVYEDLEQVHKDDIEEMDLKCDTAGYDKSKVECFNCHKIGHFAGECRGPRNQDSRNRNQDSSKRTINVEETSSKSMVAIDGAGFDWSYMAVDEVPTNIAPMAFSDSEKSSNSLSLKAMDLRVLVKIISNECYGKSPVAHWLRHMTGNMSYLSEFKEFDGGYATFRGGAKGGKITGKGTLKTADESQVLLKVPRKNNMYSVDMKNIVPKECLTCLIAIGPTCEINVMHRRLASKDETSSILKNFITEIENVVDKKVKIIICDNGTELKNRVMSEFCKQKGIKMEFSIARTPQQNGVAERRNRTLIEAARMLGLKMTSRIL